LSHSICCLHRSVVHRSSGPPRAARPFHGPFRPQVFLPSQATARPQASGRPALRFMASRAPRPTARFNNPRAGRAARGVHAIDLRGFAARVPSLAVALRATASGLNQPALDLCERADRRAHRVGVDRVSGNSPGRPSPCSPRVPAVAPQAPVVRAPDQCQPDTFKTKKTNRPAVQLMKKPETGAAGAPSPRRQRSAGRLLTQPAAMPARCCSKTAATGRRSAAL